MGRARRHRHAVRGAVRLCRRTLRGLPSRQTSERECFLAGTIQSHLKRWNALSLARSLAAMASMASPEAAKGLAAPPWTRSACLLSLHLEQVERAVPSAFSGCDGRHGFPGKRRRDSSLHPGQGARASCRSILNRWNALSRARSLAVMARMASPESGEETRRSTPERGKDVSGPTNPVHPLGTITVTGTGSSSTKTGCSSVTAFSWYVGR